MNKRLLLPFVIAAFASMPAHADDMTGSPMMVTQEQMKVIHTALVAAVKAAPDVPVRVVTPFVACVTKHGIDNEVNLQNSTVLGVPSKRAGGRMSFYICPVLYAEGEKPPFVPPIELMRQQKAKEQAAAERATLMQAGND